MYIIKQSQSPLLSKISLLVLLMLASGNAIAQNLQKNSRKLTSIEQGIRSQLNRYIATGYDCTTLDKSSFEKMGNVIDAEGYLDDGQEEEIENAVIALQNKKPVKIMVVLKDDTGGDFFAIRLLSADNALEEDDCLGIGDEGKDNGLLVSLNITDRRTFIASGYSAEYVLPDAELKRIQLLGNPYFQNGDIVGGVKKILAGIDEHLSQADVDELNESSGRPSDANKLWRIVAILLALSSSGLVYNLITKAKKKFDQKIKTYNTAYQLLQNSTSGIEQDKSTFATVSSAISQSDYREYPWAENDLDTCLEEATSAVNVGEIGKTAFPPKQLEGPRAFTYSLFRRTLITPEIIQEIEQLADTCNKDFQQIHGPVSKLELYRTSFVFMRDELPAYISDINERIQSITELQNSYRAKSLKFPAIEKDIQSLIIKLQELMKKIQLDTSSLQDKIEQKNLINVHKATLEKHRESLVALYEAYPENYKKLPDVTLNETHTLHYTDLLNSLLEITDTDTEPYTLNGSMGSKMDYVSTQNQEIQLYLEAYKDKDIEQTSVRFDTIARMYATVQEATTQLSEYLDTMQTAKEKVPAAITACQTAMKSIEDDDDVHFRLKEERSLAKERLRQLKTLAESRKNNWPQLLKDLESLEEKIQKIQSDSDEEYAKDRREAEAEEARKAAEQARKEAEADTDKEDQWGNDDGGDDDGGDGGSPMGGGGGGGGGAGGNW